MSHELMATRPSHNLEANGTLHLKFDLHVEQGCSQNEDRAGEVFIKDPGIIPTSHIATWVVANIMGV